MKHSIHARRLVGASLRVQRGFTLVELFVAVAIALFLLIGLFTLISTTRQTFGTQNQLAQLQDNERLAMTMITDVIQAAGYFPDPQAKTQAQALPASSPQFTQAGQAITGTSAASAPGDSISVRYVTAGGDGVINCTGGTNSATTIFVNVFSVNSSNELGCTMNGTWQPLVSGVQQLKIFYGVDTAGNGSVDSYLDASAMTAAYWSNVMSVKVQLTFLNPLASQPGQAATISFTRVVSVMNKS